MAVLGNGGKTIIRDFYDKLKKLVTNDAVEKHLIDYLSEREIAKRSTALAQLLELASKQELEIRKIKPEERFSEDGSVLDVAFTKAQKEMLFQAKERLAKIEKAFEKGMQGDMTDVYNLTKDKSGGGKESQG